MRPAVSGAQLRKGIEGGAFVAGRQMKSLGAAGLEIVNHLRPKINYEAKQSNPSGGSGVALGDRSICAATGGGRAQVGSRRAGPRLFALAMTSAVAGCGGGGGSGGRGTVDAQPASYYETTEYQANYGLGVIGASSAYAAGATGRGITVGVVDTGIDVDHPELTGQIAAASTDIVSRDPQFVNDIDGHGTAVAGVIAARRNQALMRGVAFKAKLLAVRADTPGSCATGCTSSQSNIAAATDYAVAQGKVIPRRCQQPRCAAP